MGFIVGCTLGIGTDTGAFVGATVVWATLGGFDGTAMWETVEETNVPVSIGLFVGISVGISVGCCEGFVVGDDAGTVAIGSVVGAFVLPSFVVWTFVLSAGIIVVLVTDVDMDELVLVVGNKVVTEGTVVGVSVGVAVIFNVERFEFERFIVGKKVVSFIWVVINVVSGVEDCGTFVVSVGLGGDPEPVLVVLALISWLEFETLKPIFTTIKKETATIGDSILL